MKKRILSALLGVFLFSQSTNAENVVQVLPITTSAGITSDDALFLTFQMTNEEENIIGIQFEIKLPDGMDFDVSDPVNYPPFELILDPRFPYTGRTKVYQHSVNYGDKDAEGFWTVVISSSQLNPIKELSGEIMKGYFTTDPSMEPGIYPIIIRNAKLGISGSEKAETADIACSYVVIGDSKSPKNATDVDLSGMTGYIPSFVINQLNTDIASNSNLKSLNLSGTTAANLGASITAPAGSEMLWYTSDKASFNRTFTKGNWSTVCLPFGLGSTQVNALKADCEITEMSTYDATNFSFTTAEVSSMEAGKPYLVKCTASANKDLFADVSISGTTDSPSSTTSGNLAMKGTFTNTNLTSTTSQNFYGFTNGTFVHATTGTVQPFRAYLELTGSAGTRTIGFDGDGSGTTSINSVTEISAEDTPVYNLQGMNINQKQPAKGVYVRNGKKIIIK